MEKKQIKELNNSDYIKIQRNIEILETDLQWIENKLNAWMNKRRTCHKEMLALYRKAREFKYHEKKVEKELLENKNIASDFYRQFTNLLNRNDKILTELRHYRRNLIQKQIRPPTPHEKLIIKKKISFDKYKKEKLAIALEKQKAGKRLHVSELKLILDHSKK
ncbi:MAG: hypothetical protein EU548_10085 [Promethearchaeota archaeon]|nr:MAG: hypothetical protein EU548_10085 [Candidatus Lokiarchaeota archaeon]